jgi:aquaporin Z
VPYAEKNTGVKKYIAEALGTFALVFCGTGAIVVNEVTGGTITHVGVAITFGLIVMAMIYTFGDKSGAHFNPAVTIAFTLYKVFPSREILPYIVSQLAGAFGASITLKLLFPASVYLGATLPAGSNLQSLVLETILTFFLMLTIVNVAESGKEKGLFAGIAIGSVVLLEALFAGPVCGASMNPARSLAPAVVSGHFETVWIYIAAPVTGAAFAVLVHKLIK